MLCGSRKAGNHIPQPFVVTGKLKESEYSREPQNADDAQRRGTATVQAQGNVVWRNGNNVNNVEGLLLRVRDGRRGGKKK